MSGNWLTEDRIQWDYVPIATGNFTMPRKAGN